MLFKQFGQETNGICLLNSTREVGLIVELLKMQTQEDLVMIRMSDKSVGNKAKMQFITDDGNQNDSRFLKSSKYSTKNLFYSRTI